MMVLRQALLLSVLVACGRTESGHPELVSSQLDASFRIDAGPDGGRPDASLTERDGGRVDAGLSDGGTGLADGGATVQPRPCLPGRFPLERPTPTIMLVLDASASMNAPFDTSTVFETVRTTLRAVLPRFGAASFGLSIFPAGDSCIAPRLQLPPAPNQLTEVQRRLDSRMVEGPSPIAEALSIATQALVGARLERRARGIILITDGQPNCNDALDPLTCRCLRKVCTPKDCLDDVRTTSRVHQALALGVPTWVIGIDAPDAGPDPVLNALASAGGRPLSGARAYYSAVNALSMGLALQQVNTEFNACVLWSPSVPNSGGTLVVRRNGLVVPAGDGGWLFTDRDNGELALSGAACDDAIADGGQYEADVLCGP